MRYVPALIGFGIAAATSIGIPSISFATADVPLDDPVYLQLYRLQDRGLIPVAPLSGLLPLTESRVQTLLLSAKQPLNGFLLPPNVAGLWIRPATRLSSRLDFNDSLARAYSVPARPRGLAGTVDLACEHQEGRPCGSGALGLMELDSSMGYGSWISAFSRLSSNVSSDESAAVKVDRLYGNLELGPTEFSVGRNILSIGPGRRTQLIWGSQPPPLTHIGLSVGSIDLDPIRVKLGGAYFVGRLDSPQRFRGNLVTVSRAYLQIADRLSLGISNLMLLGGDGAPSFTFGQFIEEHLHRTGQWPGTGISDRRVAGDLTLQVPSLKSTFYVEVAFEDSRKQFASALAYDTDYLVGWAASSLGRNGTYGFLIEFSRTGVRSQEHDTFATGTTSGARTLGSALGPEATSVYVSPRWDISKLAVSVSPWSEVVRIGSDLYDFPENAAIRRRASGLAEVRLRAGLKLLGNLTDALRFEAGGFTERVHNEAFQLGSRTNMGLYVSLTARGFGTQKVATSK